MFSIFFLYLAAPLAKDSATPETTFVWPLLKPFFSLGPIWRGVWARGLSVGSLDFLCKGPHMEARALLRDILPVLWLHQGAGVLVRLAGQGDLKAPIRIVNPSMLELPMPWFEAG